MDKMLFASNTPLTDAAKLRCGFQAVPFEFEEHARSLERQLAALRARLAVAEELAAILVDAQEVGMGDDAHDLKVRQNSRAAIAKWKEAQP